MSPPLLSLKNLSKSFAGVPAVKPISLDLSAGQILGLVGENGAGKSTLIKLLSGLHLPDSGIIRFQGHPIVLETPRAAIGHGIATIHQELEYAAHLSVAENMLLGEEWPRNFFGGVHWRSLHEQARNRLRAFGIDLPTGAAMSQLTAAEQQEVALVLLRGLQVNVDHGNPESFEPFTESLPHERLDDHEVGRERGNLFGTNLAFEYRLLAVVIIY